MNLGPAEIGLLVLAVMLLFGYKKLPDASRSLGRSLRILKTEVDAARDRTPEDDAQGAGVPSGVTTSQVPPKSSTS
jgi:sec-independent protein translocase protein TatA